MENVFNLFVSLYQLLDDGNESVEFVECILIPCVFMFSYGEDDVLIESLGLLNSVFQSIQAINSS